MLSSAYRILTDLGGPVIDRYLRKRLAAGKEDAARFSERLGVASRPRPEGRLVWCHAASVGEAASFLALIERLRELYPETQILITTGTVTSAGMLANRLPEGVVHQYVPVDRMPYVQAFLDHWKPDLALWIESELWPNILLSLKKRNIPVIMLNGIISEKSFRNWYRFKSWAKQIMGAFVLCIAQTEEDRSRFVALGARPVRYIANMKYSAKPLPFDALAYGDLKDRIKERPLWLMASTHQGEEEIALETHQKLLEQWPELLTIIVPRHPARGDEITEKIGETNLTMARRSRNDVIKSGTQVYLADTMGELGLFYRLCRIMCMGGSFVPVGGHNLIEPAQLGCAIIFGPYMHENAEIKREFMEHHAAIALQNANEMTFTVNRLLSSPETRDRYGYAARILAEQKRNVLDKIVKALEPWLGQTVEQKVRA